MIGHSPVDVDKAVSAGLEGHESTSNSSSSSSSSDPQGNGGGGGGSLGGRRGQGQGSGSVSGLGDEITNESTASDIAKVGWDGVGCSLWV